ncbi:hypothetical protein [Kiloniella sp. b19]|uniref:hypothetical protein n=1 Tax=Kiloniella sp. GXU_MW_B19 TaxID=3141326 RepID=UPI0031D3D06B
MSRDVFHQTVALGYGGEALLGKDEQGRYFVFRLKGPKFRARLKRSDMFPEEGLHYRHTPSGLLLTHIAWYDAKPESPTEMERLMGQTMRSVLRVIKLEQAL